MRNAVFGVELHFCRGDQPLFAVLSSRAGAVCENCATWSGSLNRERVSAVERTSLYLGAYCGGQCRPERMDTTWGRFALFPAASSSRPQTVHRSALGPRRVLAGGRPAAAAACLQSAIDCRHCSVPRVRRVPTQLAPPPPPPLVSASRPARGRFQSSANHDNRVAILRSSSANFARMLCLLRAETPGLLSLLPASCCGCSTCAVPVVAAERPTSRGRGVSQRVRFRGPPPENWGLTLVLTCTSSKLSVHLDPCIAEQSNRSLSVVHRSRSPLLTSSRADGVFGVARNAACVSTAWHRASLPTQVQQSCKAIACFFSDWQSRRIKDIAEFCSWHA